MRKRNYIGKEICGNCSGNPPKGILEKIREIIGNLQLVVRIRGVNIFKNIPPYPPFKLGEMQKIGYWNFGGVGDLAIGILCAILIEKIAKSPTRMGIRGGVFFQKQLVHCEFKSGSLKR